MKLTFSLFSESDKPSKSEMKNTHKNEYKRNILFINVNTNSLL